MYHEHQCPWGQQLGATGRPSEQGSSTTGCANAGSQGRKRGLAGLTGILPRKREAGAEGSGGCFSERRPRGGAAGFLPRATASLTVPEGTRALQQISAPSEQDTVKCSLREPTQLLWSWSGSSYRWLRQPAAGLFLGAYRGLFICFLTFFCLKSCVTAVFCLPSTW